jgi:uncharacterized iron-regulated protein
MIERILIVLAAFALLAVPGASAAADGRAVLRISDAKQISFGDMIVEIADSQVVFVGEVHSVAEHHRIELAVIRALHDAGSPLMVGLEMFRADSQDGLDRWVAGSLDEPSFRKLYERNWSEPWSLYRDILLFAREKRIPLIGLNVDEGVAGKVARSGFASLTPAERAKLPPGISCTVDETYEEFIRRAHGAIARKGRSFRHFCEAQMVWDSSMAYTLAAALVRTPGRTAVVLAGSGHAWRRGIPAQFRRIMPDVRTSVVLPVIGDAVISGTVTKDDADFVVF